LGIRGNHDASAPGDSQANGVAENHNRDIELCAASLLAHAGIPLAYWPLALPCYCFGRNVAIIDGDSPYRRRFGDNFDQKKMFPFGSEIKFVASKIAGDQTWQFDATTQPGIFLGYAINSSCVWSGAYLVAHTRQFTNMNYHTGHRKDNDETIVIQIVRDVPRIDEAQDAQFRFPLEEHYDRAFNTPEGWLDSWWREQPTMCRIPTAACAGDHPSTIDVMLSSHMVQIDVDPDIPPDSSRPLDISFGVQDSDDAKMEQPRITPAVVMPAGDGLVTIQPELAATECPTEEGSDLEHLLTDAEWATFEKMTNVREFAYDNWMQEVMQGRVGEGPPEKRIGERPPMALVVARTFLDMTTGQILTINGVEHYRVPYVQVPDAEACTPILLPERIRLRIIHYYDSTEWKPKGNWGNGRYIKWIRKITRPFAMWPEVWNHVGDIRQHLAIYRSGAKRSNAEP
jgi:hypothetical protein